MYENVRVLCAEFLFIFCACICVCCSCSIHKEQYSLYYNKECTHDKNTKGKSNKRRRKIENSYLMLFLFNMVYTFSFFLYHIFCLPIFKYFRYKTSPIKDQEFQELIRRYFGFIKFDFNSHGCVFCHHYFSSRSRLAPLTMNTVVELNII